MNVREITVNNHVLFDINSTLTEPLRGMRVIGCTRGHAAQGKPEAAGIHFIARLPMRRGKSSYVCTERN